MIAQKIIVGTGDVIEYLYSAYYLIERQESLVEVDVPFTAAFL